MDLNPSWVFALNQAVAQRLAFGREVVSPLVHMPPLRSIGGFKKATIVYSARDFIVKAKLSTIRSRSWFSIGWAIYLSVCCF